MRHDSTDRYSGPLVRLALVGADGSGSSPLEREHAGTVDGGVDPFGSPPLARERTARSWRGSLQQGSPLLARGARARQAVRTAHPRSRGKHDDDAAGLTRYPGSPPLARGAPGGLCG